jgi:hypothetical protein
MRVDSRHEQDESQLLRLQYAHDGSDVRLLLLYAQESSSQEQKDCQLRGVQSFCYRYLKGRNRWKNYHHDQKHPQQIHSGNVAREVLGKS